MSRTIAPIGTWSDMLFSMEMDNAIKNGYQIEILWGYKFEKDNIFKEYVEFLYNLRIQYPKSHPLNYIAKILLNSLYGRFGMDDNFTDVNIIHKDHIADFENKYLDLIISKTELEDYFLIESKLILELIEDESIHNVSIAIAAAITAYARIHMTQFKNNHDFILYYSDTDSIYVDRPLPDYLVNDTILGKLKLEYICKKAIFLAPKVYYLQTEDGRVIYKVKGLSHNISLTKQEFSSLLNKENFLEKLQIKWRKNLNLGNISVINQLYTLKITDNKRKLIYNNDNKLIGTTPDFKYFFIIKYIYNYSYIIINCKLDDFYVILSNKI